MKFPNIKIFLSILVIAGLFGCTKKQVPVEESTTDQMDSDLKTGEVINIFQMKGHSYTVKDFYEVDLFGRQLEDGKFYEVTADISYLNGGIAGYVDFPEIKHIIDCKEISPFDLNLPFITEYRYGMTLIGDYAEGDIFLSQIRVKAVWKDGNWIWSYDKEKDREDGTSVCYQFGTSEEEIEEGIEKGILSCEKYFVLPASGS